MGKWMDMNNDGRLDFITARANAKAGAGQLVWFEHPAEGLSTNGLWTEHVVCTDCTDVNFEIVEVPQFKHEYVVFSAEFFN